MSTAEQSNHPARPLVRHGVPGRRSASPLVLIASTALVLGTALAEAGPCTTEIAALERKIASAGMNPAVGPSAPQSLGAQLHHQPTPGSVERAENTANADGLAALERAQLADAEGDAAACTKALRRAKDIYGIQ
jgi:hypothetical protein